MDKLNPYLRELFVALVIFEHMAAEGEITEPEVKVFIREIMNKTAPMIAAGTRAAWRQEVSDTLRANPVP